MDTLLQDLRYGFRVLLKSPGFTIVAVLTLALGIGANSAMFSVVNSILLRPLALHDPARIISVSEKQPNGGINILSTASFLQWKQQGGVFSGLSALTVSNFNLAGEDGAQRVSGAKASAGLLPMLGVQPSLGRTFSEADDVPGSGHVVILSHALWRDRFASSPDILGKTLTLDGAAFTVVGVMPPGFHVLSDTELLWTPLQLPSVNSAASARNVHWLFAFLRLAPGTSETQAQAAADAIATRLKREDPNSELGMTLQPLGAYLTGNVRSPLLLLMGCVGFVLLIACSNVANLLLARGTARRREISVRAALGARRSRLVRQWLTESVLLAALGGVLGLILAYGALQVLVALHPVSLPQVETVTIDLSVLAFTLAVCVLVGVLFGIAPALEATRVDLNEALKEAARGASSGMGKHRVVLVVSETALALMLLIGAGLALKSLWRLSSVDPGFNPQSVLTFRISAPGRLTGESVPAFYRDVLEKIRALPGVQDAALVRDLPMSGTDPSMPITVEGNAPPPEGQIVSRYRAIGPGYFRALQTPLLRGREFSEQDTAAAPAVVIVSQSLAQEYWLGQDPVGKHLQPKMPGAPWYTVVGVAGDVRHGGLDSVIEPTAYYAYTQVPASFLPLVESYMTIAVRTRGESSGLLSSIRAAVAQVDKSVPVFSVRTLDGIVADAGSLRRFDMSLLGTFAALALTLAAIGIYGVMAYAVSLRTREIGIRMTLGATPRDILRMLVGNGARLAVAGVAVGVAGALALSRLLSSFIYGVSPTDAATFAAVAVIVLLVILLACYLPARRATRVDPIVALRYE